MPHTPPPRWWREDRAFDAETARWPCRPRLEAAAARRGVSARVLALELVAAALAGLGGPRVSRSRTGGAETSSRRSDSRAAPRRVSSRVPRARERKR